MTTIFGHITKEHEYQLKEAIAYGIVNMVRIARGNTVSFTYRQLLQYSNTALSEKLLNVLRNERKASLGAILVQIKFYLTILNDKGIISNIEKKSGWYRYYMYKNEVNEFWELCKNNPGMAMKLLIDLMSDGGE